MVRQVFDDAENFTESDNGSGRKELEAARVGAEMFLGIARQEFVAAVLATSHAQLDLWDDREVFFRLASTEPESVPVRLAMAVAIFLPTRSWLEFFTANGTIHNVTSKWNVEVGNGRAVQNVFLLNVWGGG